MLRKGIFIGQEFVDGLQLSFDEVKERIEPADAAEQFHKEQVRTMPLADMEPFMPEDLLPLTAAEGYIPVPKNEAEEGKRSTRLGGIVKAHPVDHFIAVFPADTGNVDQRPDEAECAA